jgi:endonuclease III
MCGMKKQEKAKKVERILHELFPSPKIPLAHSNHFTLLIAVLLSAQCTDERVNTITPMLFKLASTPQEMIALSIPTIEEIIRPCGLYRNKAKAIFSLSKELLERFGGTVPSDLLALESLPGVGHKTAQVVISQGWKQPAFPVDTHIHRCAKRWGLSKGRNVLETEKDLKKLFPKESWNILHLQIIYYARAHCPARGHSMENCPICLEIAGSQN